MSMLTPPGLKGKQYRITGTTYPRLSRPNHRRRRITFAITGVLVLAVLGWGTIQLVGIFDGSDKKTAADGCPRTGPSAVRAVGTDARALSGDSKASPNASGHAAVPGVASATAAAPAPTFAAIPPGHAPLASTITVNVYNATNRTGLASQTAAVLKQRGFVIGKIGNAPAPLQNKVPGAAQITGAGTSAAMMTMVGAEVAGARPVVDTRKDTTVDLVIGNGFSALVTPAQAAKAVALASRPVPAPSTHCGANAAH